MLLDENAPDGGDGEIVERYIRMLYGSRDADSHRVWRMNKDSAEPTKNMLEALLRKMVEKADQQEADDVRACLFVMGEGMEHCPDGQTEGLRMAYQMLYGTETDAGSFGHFVRQQIARLKSHVFDVTVMPGQGTQNVHVLTHWRHEAAGRARPRGGVRAEDGNDEPGHVWGQSGERARGVLREVCAAVCGGGARGDYKREADEDERVWGFPDGGQGSEGREDRGVPGEGV